MKGKSPNNQSLSHPLYHPYKISDRTQRELEALLKQSKIADDITKIVHNHQLTAEKISALTGLSQRKIMLEEQNPTLNYLVRIADIMGLQVKIVFEKMYDERNRNSQQ